MSIPIDSIIWHMSDPLPSQGLVHLALDQQFNIEITAAQARRQVKRWLMNEVSHLMNTDSLTLVIGDQIVWRVPVWLGYPHTGRVGVIGSVGVDVTSGAMQADAEQKAALETEARQIAANLAPYQPLELPPAYQAIARPAACRLEILDDGSIVPLTNEDLASINETVVEV